MADDDEDSAEDGEEEQEDGDEREWHFDVQVLSNGDPQSGETVTVNFSFPVLPDTWEKATTDGDGHAEFTYLHVGFPFAAPESIRIEVQGQTFGPYGLEDGDGFTVDLAAADDN